MESVFYAEAARGRLVYSRCGACDAALFPPRTVCGTCGSGRISLEASSGRGSVMGETTVVRAAGGAFADWAPYQVVMVRLEEGFQMISNLVGLGAAEIDDPVEVVFLEPHEGHAVPVFALAGERPGRGRGHE